MASCLTMPAQPFKGLHLVARMIVATCHEEQALGRQKWVLPVHVWHSMRSPCTVVMPSTGYVFGD